MNELPKFNQNVALDAVLSIPHASVRFSGRLRTPPKI